jgi:hypothetical protein
MLVAFAISFIVSIPISILWVYFIDKSNKILEQDKKENHDKESI